MNEAWDLVFADEIASKDKKRMQAATDCRNDYFKFVRKITHGIFIFFYFFFIFSFNFF